MADARIPPHVVDAVRAVRELEEDVYITDEAFKSTYAHHVTTSTLYPGACGGRAPPSHCLCPPR